MSRACLAPVRAAVGDLFSDDEIDAMLDRLSARYARLKASGKAAPDDPMLWREAFESLAVDDARDNLIEARMRAASAVAKARRESFYSAFNGHAGAALQAKMVGSENTGDRTGFSTDAMGKAAEVDAHSRFTRALEDAGQLSRLADPFRAFAPDRAFEDEVAKEVARLNGEQRAPSADADARRVAEIIFADQERTRANMNRLGAWIGKLDGYISRTTHDAIKISGGFFKGLDARAREQAKASWVKTIRPLLHERTFEAGDEDALNTVSRLVRAKFAREKPDAGEGEILAAIDVEAPAAIEAARQHFLQRVWTDIVSGYRAGAAAADDLDGFTAPPSLARKLSRQRVLHFADAESWLSYNRQFGTGSLFQSHLSFLSRAARSEALMRSFGPAPEAAFKGDLQRLAKRARDDGDTVAVKALANWRRQAEFDQLTGAAEMPGSHRLATVSRAIRSWTQLAKLGGMIFSSVTDLGNGSQSLARAGVQHLKSYGGLAASVGNIADPVVRREVANLVGEGARAMAGDIAAQFTAPDANLGLMFKAQRVFYRVNLFQFWQARLRAGAATILARHLGERAGLAHAALDDATRDHLTRYGIDSGAWEMLRARAADLDEGRVLTPDAAEQVDADLVAAWGEKTLAWDGAQMEDARARIGAAIGDLNAAGRTLNAEVAWTGLSKDKREALAAVGVTRRLWDSLRDAAARADGGQAIVQPSAIDGVTRDLIGEELKLDQAYRPDDVEDARRELQLRLQAYFTDTIDTAMTEPRARERAILRGGTRSGTPLGMALELLMQFKSFPLAVMTRHLGPAWKQAGLLSEKMKAGDTAGAMAAIAPLAHILTASTVLGYAAMTMKDLARGIEPQPFEDEEGKPNTAIFLRAFIQGGGGGLYADFVMGDYDRFGRSPWAAVAGPSIGEAERALRIFTQVRKGEFGDAGADAARLAVDNTPFLNLFYTRLALNYWLLYQMQEEISPGYLQRMEESLRDNRGGQEYYYPPSEMAQSR